MTRLFGTDGIRGVANEEPLTPDLAFRVGRQLAAVLDAAGVPCAPIQTVDQVMEHPQTQGLGVPCAA